MPVKLAQERNLDIIQKLERLVHNVVSPQETAAPDKILLQDPVEYLKTGNGPQFFNDGLRIRHRGIGHRSYNGSKSLPGYLVWLSSLHAPPTYSLALLRSHRAGSICKVFFILVIGLGSRQQVIEESRWERRVRAK